MESKKMRFDYVKLKNNGFDKQKATCVSFESSQEISSEDYDVYDKVLKTYMDYADHYNFDITRVVTDIRSLFRGIHETSLLISLENEDKNQMVHYENGSVECYLESTSWNNRIIANDSKEGFKVEYIKSKESLSSENEEDFINSITNLKDKIINLKLLGQNQKLDVPTIFGYTLDQIKEDELTFEFDISFVGLQITAKPTKVKKLTYEGIDAERLKELDEITDRGRRGSV